ncbi:hypothetical protein ACJX0J_020220, partial [Zea mays]
SYENSGLVVQEEEGPFPEKDSVNAEAENSKQAHSNEEAWSQRMMKKKCQRLRILGFIDPCAEWLEMIETMQAIRSIEEEKQKALNNYNMDSLLSWKEGDPFLSSGLS